MLKVRRTQINEQQYDRKDLPSHIMFTPILQIYSTMGDATLYRDFL